MNKKHMVKALLVVALLSFSLMLSTGALMAAEDAEADTVAAEAVPENPIGLGVLMFLLGAGGVVTVGGVMMARDSFSAPQEAA